MSATRFSKKTMPSAQAVSSALAPMSGATEPIAVPPQIAVPLVMRVRSVPLMKNSLASVTPSRAAIPMYAAPTAK